VLTSGVGVLSMPTEPHDSAVELAGDPSIPHDHELFTLSASSPRGLLMP